MTAIVETFTRLLNIADIDINSIVLDVVVVVGDPDIFFCNFCLGITPLPPLTENHSAQKPLAERRALEGYPPPLTEKIR